jgi:hypothetical protein
MIFCLPEPKRKEFAYEKKEHHGGGWGCGWLD